MRVFTGFRMALAAATLALGAACASAPDAHDMSGEWRFSIEVSAERVTEGALTLERTAAGYTGVLTTNRGDQVLPVQSFTLAGADVALTVVSPEGAVTFEGQIEPDGDAFSGVVTYHNGQRYPMRAARAFR